MKQPEYIEGRQATENFEEGMKALFKVPKDLVGEGEGQARGPSTSGRRCSEDRVTAVSGALMGRG